MTIWVIAIEYDYGVKAEAGWFLSEREAQAWIDAEHARRRADWNARPGQKYDYDECRTKFYPQRVDRTNDDRCVTCGKNRVRYVSGMCGVCDAISGNPTERL